MSGESLIKLYLDEDVDVLIADLIRSHGFQVVTTNEAGRKGKSDAEQLEFAASQGWVIVTNNRLDFEELAKDYFDSGKTHCGIIVAVRRSAQEITQRLLDTLNDFTADEMVNQIHYI